MKRPRKVPPRALGVVAVTGALVGVIAAFGGPGFAQTAAQSEYAPTNTTPPSISGTAQEGQTLTAGQGTWTSTTTPTFTYQWARCNTSGASCADVAGSTTQTYAVQSGDNGSTLRVRVTASNTGGSASATSAQTATVQAKTAAPTPGGNSKTVQAATVKLPNRLVVDGVRFSPRVLTSHSPFTVRFHVAESEGKNPVQGALVFALGLPYSWAKSGQEGTTDENGWATITMSPTFRMPLRRGGALVVFVRARIQGDSVLAGASTRRLVQVLIR